MAAGAPVELVFNRDKHQEHLSIEDSVLVNKCELKVEHILDSRVDKDGKTEYKTRVVTHVWLPEADLQKHPFMIKKYWKAHKKLQALKLTRGLKRKSKETETEIHDGKEISKEQPTIATKKNTDVVPATNISKVFDDKNKDVTLEQSKHGQEKQIMALNQKKVNFVPKRSKRLKENDEKLSSFYCKPCGKSFRNEDIFTAHLLDHEGLPRMELSEDMFVVQHVGDKKKLYRCRLCSEQFREKRDAVSHQRVHGGTNPWFCKQCDKHFLRKYKYNRHLLMHTGTENFTCDDCGKSFNGADYLKRHQETYCPSSDKTGFECDICGEIFQEKRLLEAHIGIHDGTNPFYCEQCQKYFLKKTLFECHMNEHEQVKPYRCAACTNRFLSKSDYNRHVKLHDDELYICSSCKEVYSLQEDLEMHYQMSEACVEVICTECNVEFPCISDLRNHLQSFAASKNPKNPTEAVYLCRFCQRGFHVYSTFLQHRTIHVCEKRQTCSHCDMNFATKEKLEAHVKQIHGVTTYPCYDCGKVFDDSVNLKRHTKAAHGSEMSFHCAPCDVLLLSRCDYNQHLQSKQHSKSVQEHGEHEKVIDLSSNKLVCSICERVFPNINELTRHEYLHQRVEVKPNDAVIKDAVVDSSASPAYYQTGLYGMHAGEQILLTDQQGRLVSAKINVDAAGNIGFLYVPHTEGNRADSSQLLTPDENVPQESINTGKPDSHVSATPVIQVCQSERNAYGDVVSLAAAQSCNEETFLALSEMVQQGKIDISSLQVIQNADDWNKTKE